MSLRFRLCSQRSEHRWNGGFSMHWSGRKRLAAVRPCLNQHPDFVQHFFYFWNFQESLKRWGKSGNSTKIARWLIFKKNRSTKTYGKPPADILDLKRWFTKTCFYGIYHPYGHPEVKVSWRFSIFPKCIWCVRFRPLQNPGGSKVKMHPTRWVFHLNLARRRGEIF